MIVRLNDIFLNVQGRTGQDEGVLNDIFLNAQGRTGQKHLYEVHSTLGSAEFFL